MVSYRAFINKIKEGVYAPVYLFYGEEKYLQEELTNFVASIFLGQDSSFGLEKLAGNSLGFDEVLARFDESGLFAERRLLVVDNPSYLAPPRKKADDSQALDEKPKASGEKTHGELLAGYLEEQGPGCPDSIIIFWAAKVDRRKKLFKLIEKQGAVVECSPLKGEALAAWIRNKASKLDKKIERPALERLMMAGEQNLHYLSGELEKYAAYLGNDQEIITLDTVEALFSGDIQGDVFKLSDAMAEGNLSRAHDLLDLLLRRREKPLLLFFMLVRHYRLLLQAHSLMEEGLPQNDFASALEVHPFAARKLREQAVSYSRQILEEVLIALQQADNQIKTGRVEPMQALKLTLSRVDYLQSTSSSSV